MDPDDYIIRIKLLRNDRPCHFGHQVGDEWEFDHATPAGMCSMAYNSLYPVIFTLRNGGSFPWQEDPDVVEMSCPDGEVHNIFEVRRIPRPPG